MPNIKTYDLIQCSRLYPTVNGANNASFLPYVDMIVEINNDSQQSYTVKENIQARFFAPTSADSTSNVQYSVTSVVFNGLEALSATANLTVEDADNIHIDFPLYLGDPNGYDNNQAKATITEQVGASLGYFERNFADFMQTLLDSLGISVKITNSHPEWWSLDGYEVMKNFMVEMYSSDSFSFTMTETYDGVSRELKYSVDGTGATAYIDGVDVTVIPVLASQQPQFDDEYSIYSYPVVANPITEIDCCPVVSPFYASLFNGCSSTLESTSNCAGLTFADNSNYDNGLLGHDPLFFNHRIITLTRPDGSQYIWSTDGTVGQPIPSGCGCSLVIPQTETIDQLINPHWNSNNIFNYSFTDSDVDGLYEVNICTYPDWQDDIFYDSALNYFVYRNGVIYKQVTSSTGVDPELDTDNVYWTVALSTDDRGRYCSKARILILCIKIMDCYKKKVEKALCDIKYNPCADMCDNLEFMNAMKMRVVMDAVEFAFKSKRWSLVKEHVSILRALCCCNG